MLAKRIIPCLDVRDNQVVKGVQFTNHRSVGDILPLAQRYYEEGADELVFYDITASSDKRSVATHWIEQIAATIAIPFTVAGGIRNKQQACTVLHAGADKISINSPALENPDLINQLAAELGSQCVVIGIDSAWVEDDFYVYQYTGDSRKTLHTGRKTSAWIKEVQERGAGEIVLNCMQADGVRRGYDLAQLAAMRQMTTLPLIASGGAGTMQHFLEVFTQTGVDGALAASVFHDQTFTIGQLKAQLSQANTVVRLC